MSEPLTVESFRAYVRDAASKQRGVILSWQEVVALDRMPDYAGHRIEGEHDCFAMNCKDLGPEVSRLREQVASLSMLLGEEADRRYHQGDQTNRYQHPLVHPCCSTEARDFLDKFGEPSQRLP